MQGRNNFSEKDPASFSQTPRHSPGKGGCWCPAILTQLLNKISSPKPREERLKRWEVMLQVQRILLNYQTQLAGQRSPAHHDICLVSGSASCIPYVTTHCGPELLCWKEVTPLPSLFLEKLAKACQRHHAAVM